MATRPLQRNTFTLTGAQFNPSTRALIWHLNNVRPDELHSALLNALTCSDTLPKQHADNLLAAFMAANVPHSRNALPALNVPASRHCLRCHKGYYEIDNGLAACQIAHVIQVATDNTVYPAMMGISNPCCPNSEVTMYHFKGRHTTNIQAVHFDDAIQRCEIIHGLDYQWVPWVPDRSTSQLGEHLDREMDSLDDSDDGTATDVGENDTDIEEDENPESLMGPQPQQESPNHGQFLHGRL
ncbi:hypothetical protein B0H15DRAFT_808324 [Mycena belliarum]|uniref:Uncharacterized protein n=1 Tax=Mycena belliarum TaxID=1033014 RepID=A0AAD6UMW3_9AGAR|nr:hypothetical protein B0H15DRAFT_808324 [Mycena belliae]